jgi:hypothetical protein
MKTAFLATYLLLLLVMGVAMLGVIGKSMHLSELVSAAEKDRARVREILMGLEIPPSNTRCR